MKGGHRPSKLNHTLEVYNMAFVTGMTDEQVRELVRKDAERKAKEKRYWVRQSLILKKAAAAGIKVTEAEIDAEIARKK